MVDYGKKKKKEQKNKAFVCGFVVYAQNFTREE